jgi:hypothetical protein
MADAMDGLMVQFFVYQQININKLASCEEQHHSIRVPMINMTTLKNQDLKSTIEKFKHQ